MILFDHNIFSSSVFSPIWLASFLVIIEKETIDVKLSHLFLKEISVEDTTICNYERQSVQHKSLITALSFDGNDRQLKRYLFGYKSAQL